VDEGRRMADEINCRMVPRSGQPTMSSLMARMVPIAWGQMNRIRRELGISEMNAPTTPEELAAAEPGLVQCREETAVNGMSQKASGWQTKRAGRYKTAPRERELTEKQKRALLLYGEHKGNTAAVARTMGLDPSTARQHIDAGLRKAGRKKSDYRKPKHQDIPTDKDGQPAVTDEQGAPRYLKSAR